jgi:hypothetical protein
MIERFRNMAQDMLAKVAEQLWQLCWADTAGERVVIDLAQVEDNVSFTKRGRSFIDCSGNRLSQGLSWMLAQARDREGGMQLQSPSGR